MGGQGGRLRRAAPPTTPASPIAALEKAQALDTSALPPPDELNELDAAELDALRAGGGADARWLAAPARVEPQLRRGEGHRRRALRGVSRTRSSGSRARPTTSPSTRSRRGGKEGLPDDPSRLDRLTTKLRNTFWQVQHPTHYAIIQIQPVKEQETVPGEAPPTPVADPTQPVVSVIMERNLGDVRFPGAMLTIFSGLMFAVTVQHAPPPRPAGSRGARDLPRHPRGLAADGPVPPGRRPGRAGHRLRRAEPRGLAAAGPERHHHREAFALRVRDRARAGRRPSASRCAST